MRRLLFMLCLVLSSYYLAVACASPTPVKETLSADILGIGGYEHTREYGNPTTNTVNNISEGFCWMLTYTGLEGNVIGTDCGVAPGGAKPEPAGTSNTDMAIIPCEECESGADDFEGNPVPNPGSFPYAFMRTSSNPGPYQTHVVSVIEVEAQNLNDAQTRADIVINGGPGSELPYRTKVHGYITFLVDDSKVTVTSSLPSRFGAFTIKVNEAVVADKTTSINVTVTPAGNGWLTLTSIIPDGVINPGDTVTLSQSGVGGSAPVDYSVDF